jgi:hypothetical protein
MALFEATKELTWLRELLNDLNEQPQLRVIECDSQSAIELAKNPTHHQQTKHIDIKYHFVYEKLTSREIELKYRPTTEMPADMLTKALSFPAFFKHRLLFKLCDQDYKGVLDYTPNHKLKSEKSPCWDFDKHKSGNGFDPENLVCV